jgi:hypothetical protein
MRILALLEARRALQPSSAAFCEVAAEVVGITGAGVMLMSNDIPAGAGCSSCALSLQVEELQYMLGEGPCVDAYRTDEPVLVPDLAIQAVPRWVAFTPPAIAAGARAIFGFPLRIGLVRLGALNLCRDEPGSLSDEQHADALVMADVVARALLALQAEAPPGTLAAGLEAGADFRFVVHAAAGMVSAQLGVSIAEALIRLRACLWDRRDTHRGGRGCGDASGSLLMTHRGPDAEGASSRGGQHGDRARG